MRKLKNNTIKISTTILVIILLPISFLTVNQIQETSNNNPIFISAFIEHQAINITDDSEFSVFPGTGTSDDPFLIDGYNITTTSLVGIKITGTTKYFIISNCYIDTLGYGIFLDSISNGTATITNNTCINNFWDGIYLSSSHNNTVSGNNCTNNGGSIHLSSSHNNTLSGNTCINSYVGIGLDSSYNNTVNGNNCTDNGHGISMNGSNNNTISGNNCTNNNWDGIELHDSNFNLIIENILLDNEDYGVYISSSSFNYIYDNLFFNNNLGGTSQGYDDGTNNCWYDDVNLRGNYWNEWPGEGTYSIDGSANSIDLYPLDEEGNPPIISEFSYINTLILSIFLCLFSIPIFLKKRRIIT